MHTYPYRNEFNSPWLLLRWPRPEPSTGHPHRLRRLTTWPAGERSRSQSPSVAYRGRRQVPEAVSGPSRSHTAPPTNGSARGGATAGGGGDWRPPPPAWGADTAGGYVLDGGGPLNVTTPAARPRLHWPTAASPGRDQGSRAASVAGQEIHHDSYCFVCLEVGNPWLHFVLRSVLYLFSGNEGSRLDIFYISFYTYFISEIFHKYLYLCMYLLPSF